MKDNKADAMRRALTAIKSLRERLKLAESAKNEPIAITGAACRFPGGATSLDSYWELLTNGRDAIIEVPKDRWDINAYYSDNPKEKGKMNTKWGGFLAEPIDEFDADFFGISDKEAESLDPQQRGLLETCWEALENAGASADGLRNSQTGVFVGIGGFDYKHLLIRNYDPRAFDSYFGTGSIASAAAGRISYQLGLQGPCLPVDTACSSSLTAVHLAAHSLRQRECDLALVGGVNLILDPWITIYFCKMGALSADGRCRAFDEKSSGYSRSEGCGVVVLKRLTDALNNRDNILAVIRGGAVNHDGPSAGLTAPNPEAQKEVVKSALKNAEIDPNEIGYIEAHGTGTPLGDAMEMRALAKALPDRQKNNPLYIGSVKANIGHLEAASGIASLIKTALILKKGVIPPHIYFKNLNPDIYIGEWPWLIPTENTERPDLKIAGVSAFGISGTNAHVILEKAPPNNHPDENPQSGHSPLVLPISAKTPEALEELTRSYRRHLNKNKDIKIDDLHRTLIAGRSHFPRRLAIVAKSLEEAASKLKNKKDSPALQAPEPVAALILTELDFKDVLSVLENWKALPAFQESVEECELVLKHSQEPSVSETLKNPDEKNRRTLCFIAAFALGQTWLRWGVNPILAGGTGPGEPAVCSLGELLSLSDGLKLLINGPSETPEFSLPRIAIFSIANGEYIDWNAKHEDDYFEPTSPKQNRFERLYEAMLENGVNTCLTLGHPPDEFAKIFRKNNGKESKRINLKSLPLDKKLIPRALADLYESGFDINWQEIVDAKRGRLITLPNYPFKNKRFWTPYIKSKAEAFPTAQKEGGQGFQSEYSQRKSDGADLGEAEKLISKYLHGLVSNTLKVPRKDLEKALKNVRKFS